MHRRQQIESRAPATGDSAPAKGGLTPAAAELKRRIGVSPNPRTLTPEEIELLRQSAREVAQVTRQALADRTDSCEP